MDSSHSSNPSLFVGSSVDIKCLERGNWSGWKEEALDKGGVDEVSCGPAIYEGNGGNSSHSVL